MTLAEYSELALIRGCQEYPNFGRWGGRLLTDSKGPGAAQEPRPRDLRRLQEPEPPRIARPPPAEFPRKFIPTIIYKPPPPAPPG
jgi:hypothetical protein